MMSMSQSALILDPVGTALSADEYALFRESDPWGFILFQRNCVDPDQVRGLIRALHDCVGRETVPILIDEEGGRVHRLKPPHWRVYPSAQTFGEIFRTDPEAGCRAVRLNYQLMGLRLRDLGINVNCVPVLDIPIPGAHDVIGDRAFGRDPSSVARLGRAAAQGLLDAGVLPVIKHMPGHGRAAVDSHLDLPVVDTPYPELEASDFCPFQDLSDLPLGMTAHVVYSAIDPERPATLSPVVIEKVIRQQIGFDGLLMTDDLSMEALQGSPGERTQRALEAGCDVILHCNGSLEDKAEVAAACPPLADRSARRAERALAFLAPAPPSIDPRQVETEIHELFVSLGRTYALA